MQLKFPWQVSARNSLKLEIIADPETKKSIGEAFFIHPTDELPMLIGSDEIFKFDGGNYLEILIKPGVIISDKSLKIFPASDRFCYFEGERKLQFFKIYTKHNCEIECMSNFTEKASGSVGFDIVRDNKTRVQGISKEDRENYYKFEQDFRLHIPTKESLACSCLPRCELINYDFEIRESRLLGKE